MVAKREKLQIEVFAPPGDLAAAEGRLDEAVRRLARLIGRQMAREQFARQCAKEPRRSKHRQVDEAS